LALGGSSGYFGLPIQAERLTRQARRHGRQEKTGKTLLYSAVLRFYLGEVKNFGNSRILANCPALPNKLVRKIVVSGDSESEETF